MDEFEQLKAILDGVGPDVEKAVKGNGAAGRRVRKAMQAIKVKAQGVRNRVQEIRNSEVKK